MSTHQQPAQALEPVQALTTAAGDAQAALEAAQAALPAALEELAATLQDAQVVPFVAWCQDMRRLLLDLETTATEYAGRNLAGVGSAGTLPDGRTYEVKRGRNRTSWDHDEWQHDVRQEAAIRAQESMDLPPEVVNPQTGDLVSVLRLLQVGITTAQQVHGSSAPKVTALRTLGLSPDDYCETSPGRWSVTFTDPETRSGE